MTLRIKKIAGKERASLPLAFEIEGPIVKPISVGLPIVMTCPIMASDGDHYQWFNTSNVSKLSSEPLVVGAKIFTLNSVWEVTFINCD